MIINPSIFKAYDIRGIYPSEINEETVTYIARAIYTQLVQQTGITHLKIAIGRDMRASSPSLSMAVQNALVAMGGTVTNIGIVPTPTVYYALHSGPFDAALQISASHNPSQYNGIKIVRKEGTTLIKIGASTGMDTIKKMSLAMSEQTSHIPGSVNEDTSYLSKEVDAAFAAIRPTIRPLKIVIDAANAMGAPMLDEVFKRLDCEVIRMNWDLDGSFPAHQADPLQFNLWDKLRARVIAEGADLGIMPDGDADRIFFVNEKGAIIPATLITALLAKEILTKHHGKKILVDIRYIRNVAAVVKRYGGTFGISKVGHALITEQLNKEKAIFAGESSGHYYYSATGGGESAARTVLYVLYALSAQAGSFSELLHAFETSHESGEFNFKLPQAVTAQQINAEIHTHYSDGTFSDLDGIAISYPEWRFSIRSSNTEPLIRLNIEGVNSKLVAEKVRELKDRICSYGAHLV